ncbi:unnamed protein product [Closterium sp. NIES-65]|nr:unnamed protein product [Closterium sp. NIES-65]
MVPLQGLWGQLCRWAEQARLAGLPSQVLDFILQPRTPCLERATRAWERFRVCRFYLLPKLHKTPVAGRPICSSTLWVFEHASAVLDHYLRPLLRFSPSHLPDSLALLHQLEDLRVPAEALFLTYDVESLYPSIPIDAGISCIERWLLRWAAQERISGGVADTLVQLLGLVMRQNHLEFGGRFWRQVRGTAMGTPVAVIYAVLFMAWLDERLLETEPELSQHVLLHRRFIDDGVVVWTGTRERLLEWVGAFGGLEQTIRLTHEISTSQFTLLDITFSKGELWQTTAILDTTTFQKPLNVYQYFPFSSAHPSHCKRGFILGELQRYILRESSSRGFRSIRSAFYARLRARRYPDTFLQPIFSSISYARRPELLARSRARGEGEQEAQQRVLPLVLDFHPSVQQVRWGHLRRSDSYSCERRSGDWGAPLSPSPHSTSLVFCGCRAVSVSRLPPPRPSSLFHSTCTRVGPWSEHLSALRSGVLHLVGPSQQHHPPSSLFVFSHRLDPGMHDSLPPDFFDFSHTDRYEYWDAFLLFARDLGFGSMCIVPSPPLAI